MNLGLPAEEVASFQQRFLKQHVSPTSLSLGWKSARLWCGWEDQVSQMWLFSVVRQEARGGDGGRRLLDKNMFCPHQQRLRPCPSWPGPSNTLHSLLWVVRSGWARPPGFCFDLTLISGNRGLTVEAPLGPELGELTNPASGKALPFFELLAEKVGPRRSSF